MRIVRPFRLLAAAAATLLLAPTGALLAQAGPSTSRDLLLGAAVIVQPSAVPEFSNRICPGFEIGSELNGGALLTKWLGVSAFGRIQGNAGFEECVNGLIPPPPDSGTYRYTDYSQVRGYPYLSTGARLTAYSGSPEGGALRVFGGGEWLPSKRIIAPLLGGGASIPLGSVLFVFEAELRLLTVTTSLVETEFRRGQPVSSTRTEQSQRKRHLALRFGLERVFGR
jgi:hypothetical protein